MERARHRQWRHEAVRAMQRHVKPMGSMLTKEGVQLIRQVAVSLCARIMVILDHQYAAQCPLLTMSIF